MPKVLRESSALSVDKFPKASRKKSTLSGVEKSVGKRKGSQHSLKLDGKTTPAMKRFDQQTFSKHSHRAKSGGLKLDSKAHAYKKVRFHDQLKAGHLAPLTKGKVAKKIKLADQYALKHKGDVARRLHLHEHAIAHAKHANSHLHGNHRHFIHHGLINPYYAKSCFRFHYWGPGYFSGVWWYPKWHPWVHWSWHYHVHSHWDPRPIWCRPILYRPCPAWVWWHTPVWVGLPVVSSGTWVDVAPVVVGSQFDLQLLAVRFVDPGHPEQKLGPRYRVWFRNNSDQAITRPFNVMLFAGNDATLTQGLPQSGVEVTSITAGETQSVDIRLPIEVYTMGRDAEGNPAPFGTLHVLVDSHGELSEASEVNNGVRLDCGDVLPVDPAAFESEPRETPAGSEVLIAGEGFGPQPGQVLVHMAGLELDAEILGWYDLGVRLTVPGVPLAGPTEAELIVIRGDGAAANPLKITVLPPGAF